MGHIRLLTKQKNRPPQKNPTPQISFSLTLRLVACVTIGDLLERQLPAPSFAWSRGRGVHSTPLLTCSRHPPVNFNKHMLVKKFSGADSVLDVKLSIGISRLVWQGESVYLGQQPSSSWTGPQECRLETHPIHSVGSGFH